MYSVFDKNKATWTKVTDRVQQKNTHHNRTHSIHHTFVMDILYVVFLLAILQCCGNRDVIVVSFLVLSS